MAKDKSKGGVTIGPVMGGDEGLPPNPASKLRESPLPMVRTPDGTIRRPFKVPYKPFLHRNDGLSNDEFNQPKPEAEGFEDK